MVLDYSQTVQVFDKALEFSKNGKLAIAVFKGKEKSYTGEQVGQGLKIALLKEIAKIEAATKKDDKGLSAPVFACLFSIPVVTDPMLCLRTWDCID